MTILQGHSMRTVIYPNTPQGWAALNWDQLCRNVGEVHSYLTELRRQISVASTDHVLAAELSLSCPLQNRKGESVFQQEAEVHSRVALAQALRDAGPLTQVMREQTKAVRAQTKTIRRRNRGEQA